MHADEKNSAPLAVPLLAALPVSACMVILGLPELGQGYPIYRILYFVACMVWILPLALIQRALWRRGRSWPVAAMTLLAVSYAMSVANSLLGQSMAIALGRANGYRWERLTYGLDGCWLALIAFCAIHAVAVYYLALQSARLHLALAQAAARDAELRALRYQLHPHFLFNTFNAISALVSAQENRAANRMIARVADFLRATLAHNGGHEHALADELALTNAYLDIEKARLGDRLQVAMQVGPALLETPVPYLLLQPLVENAVRHGIAPRSTAGRIDIRVERHGSTLRIEVLNDADDAAKDAAGTGPTAAWLHAGEALAPAHADGIGLANVAARLRQLYGDPQQFDAGWRGDGRFRVRIALPFAATVGATAGDDDGGAGFTTSRPAEPA